MTSADWATVASLATALGTLVLAVATFSAVRSGNRTARAAELSLLTSLRPLLTPSRREDSVLKVNFGDNKWLRVPGSSAVGEIGGGDGTTRRGTSVSGRGPCVTWTIRSTSRRERRSRSTVSGSWNCCTATRTAASG